MIDLSQIKYKVIMINNASQFNITEYITNLSWEENEKELAVRITFSAKNEKTSKGYLSNIIKPGTQIRILTVVGGKQYEAVRGYVEIHNLNNSNGSDVLQCTCYDILYKLQKSQDNRFYPSGTRTKTIICGILYDWRVPYVYNGPNYWHGKQVFNNDYLSDIILDILDDARKKGAGKYIVKDVSGKVHIQKRGLNKPIYVFNAENSEALNFVTDISDMVTRVKVLGQANDSERRPIQAIVSNNTKYGIRQRIYTRGSDETHAAAHEAAWQILVGEGNIERSLTIKSADLPTLRKGDIVYINMYGVKAYYYIKSIRHDANDQIMTMEVEFARS